MKKLLKLGAWATVLVLALSACSVNAQNAEDAGSVGSVGSSENAGSSGFDASKNISVTAREDGSGTKTAFMEIIGLKGKADPANVIVQNSTAGILTEVKGNTYAIAYESLGFVTDEVKTLKVDGVEATVENIQNGTYKISRPLSVVYKEATLDSGINAAFFAFLQSGDAQQIITDEGFVSVVDGAAAYTIDGALSGEINVSGSTSLKPLMDVLVQKFSELQPNVTVNVGGGGSGQGYSDAEGDVTDFGMISEEFGAEKAPGCTFYTVCKDGIAVIVHNDNTLDGITMEQLKNIYDVDAAAAGRWDTLIS